MGKKRRREPGAGGWEKRLRAQLRSFGLGHMADLVSEAVREAAASPHTLFKKQIPDEEMGETIMNLVHFVGRHTRLLRSRHTTAEMFKVKNPGALVGLSATLYGLTLHPALVAAMEVRLDMLPDEDLRRATTRALEIVVDLMDAPALELYRAAQAAPRMVGYMGTPDGPADWREWVMLHLQAQDAEDDAPFFITAVEDIWQRDPATREEMVHEGALAQTLIVVYLGAAGFALFAEDARVPGRPISDTMRGEARAALDSMIADFAARPAVVDAVRRHLPLLPKSSPYRRAASALLAAAAQDPGSGAPRPRPPYAPRPERHRWRG